VRDAFGTLERDTVLRYLHKCLHTSQQIDRKAGGAGVGLYLMVSVAAAVSFHVIPGISTEVICMFDLQAPRPGIAQLAYLVQADPGDRVPAGPARAMLAARPSRRWPLLAGAGAAAIAIGAVIGARVLRGRGEAVAPGAASASAPAPAPVATVELDSRPAEASVEIDGKPAGSTPLTLTQLAPGSKISIVFKRTGYRPAKASLQVPAVGGVARHVQELQLSEDFVRVRFVSTPPGAEVIRTGERSTTDRTYTPAELVVEAGKVQRFTLIMPKHVPLVLEPFTPARGAGLLEKGGRLIPGASLHIEGPRDGKITVSGAPHCKELALPADCILAPGRYAIEHAGPGGGHAPRPVTMGTDDETVTLGSAAAPRR
jgi:hypothetical protein